MGAALIVPTAQAFLSPKQKYKIRQERRARYESSDEEYLYYNKIKCGVFGSCGLIVGVPATIIGLVSPMPTFDKFFLSICGPIVTLSGIFFIERCFRSGAGAVINEWGIRIRDYGLILWEEIAAIDMSTNDNDDMVFFILKDQTTITVNCAPLVGSRAAVIKKLQRFRDLRLEKSGYFSNRYVVQEKKYIQ